MVDDENGFNEFCFRDFAIEDIEWSFGRHLYKWWLDARGDRAVPSRADFRPQDHVQILPGIILLDVDDDPFKLRFRLIGTAVVDLMGHDATGSYQDEFGDDVGRTQRYKWLINTKRPYLIKGKSSMWANKDHQNYSALILPLSSDGENVDMIISHTSFENIH